MSVLLFSSVILLFLHIIYVLIYFPVVMPRCDDILTNKENSQCEEDTEKIAVEITTQPAASEKGETIIQGLITEGSIKDIHNQSFTSETATKARYLPIPSK